MNIILTILAIVLMVFGSFIIYFCLRVSNGDDEIQKYFGPKKYFSLLLQVDSIFRLGTALVFSGVVLWVYVV